MLLAVTITTLLSLALTWVVRQMARHYGMMAYPRGDRWHNRPTALLGGIAIVAAFLLGLTLFLPEDLAVRRLVAGGILLFLVGLIDDLVQIKPYIKLAAQLVASSGLVFSGLVLTWTQIPLLDSGITLLWLIGITNAINMLDNMDGLAAGTTLIATIGLSVTFALHDQSEEMLVALLLAGALAGFLVFNFHPASIFMGDCGSLFLGFTIAGIALWSSASETKNLLVVFTTPTLILLLPIFDTTIVTLGRYLHGRSVAQGGKDHTSHRLVALGMSDRQAVLLLYSIAALAGAGSLLLQQTQLQTGLAIVAGLTTTLIAFGLYLGKVEVYTPREEANRRRPDLSWLRWLPGHPYRRRLLEVAIDFHLILVAYYTAYLLRFEGEIPQAQREIFLRSLPLIIGLHLFFLLVMGVYRGLWHYAGLEEIVQIAKAVGMASICSGLAVLVWYQFSGPSRSVFFIHAGLLTLTFATSRVSFRLISRLLPQKKLPTMTGVRVLIYGAGDRGALLLQELIRDPQHGYQPLGFVDHDAEKIGKRLRGYPIFDTEYLLDLAQQHEVEEVLVAVDEIPLSVIKALDHLGIQLRKMKILFE
jgi:UDP-GlcNAc:undecaprenyl-phosphate GlcNAc-1-phosphate transferase